MTAIGKLFRTTAFKLSLIYLLVFSIFAAALIIYFARNTSLLLTHQLTQTVEAEVQGLREQYRVGGIRRLVDVIQLRSSRPGASLYLVTDPRGNPLAGNVGEVPIGVLDEPGRFPIEYKRFDEANRTYEALVEVYVLPGDFRLLVGRDLSEREIFRRILRDALEFSIALMVVLAVVGGFFISRRVLRRIDSVSEASRQIMAGNLSGRIPVIGTGDEFDRLAESLNAMLTRIEMLMAGLKEVSDNIAHDLKTPLTRMRARIEAGLREAGEDPRVERSVLEAALADCDQLIATFNALLSIARAEAARPAALEEIDLMDLLRDVADLYGPVAEEQGLNLHLEGPETLPYMADPHLLAQAVANLIDNAVKYAGESRPSSILLEARATDEGGVLVAVADHGPGIPDDMRDRVVERFVRLETARSKPGSGLGLSLAAAAARHHGGTLHLRGNQPGLRVELVLPPRNMDEGGAGE